MATPNSLVKKIFEYGEKVKLWILKADLSDAYKNLAIAFSALHTQAIYLCGVLFADGRMLFGHNLSAHRFVFMHSALQLLFVFPMIKLSETELKMAIDDSTIICDSEESGLEYYARYKFVVEMCGLRLKPHDVNLEKAFLPSPRGQALGIEFNLADRSWWAPQKKLNDLSASLDGIINKQNPAKPIAFSVNEMQKCLGILENFSHLTRLGKTLMLVPAAEEAFYLSKFHEENDLAPQKQTKLCTFSAHSRTNLLLFRALLVISPAHPLKLENPDLPQQVHCGCDITLFSDASGIPKTLSETSNNSYKPTCGGIYWPGHGRNQRPLAVSFVMPYSFLVGKAMDDGSGKHRYIQDQTVLLELIPVCAVLLQFPERFIRKSVVLHTDNLTAVNLFNNCWAKKIYTAYIIEAINIITATLETKLVLKWCRRRSSYPMEVADDLTHGDFSAARPETDCQLLSLPAPLFEVVHATTSYHAHTFNLLRGNIKSYLLSKFPHLQYPLVI